MGSAYHGEWVLEKLGDPADLDNVMSVEGRKWYERVVRKMLTATTLLLDLTSESFVVEEHDTIKSEIINYQISAERADLDTDQLLLQPTAWWDTNRAKPALRTCHGMLDHVGYVIEKEILWEVEEEGTKMRRTVKVTARGQTGVVVQTFSKRLPRAATFRFGAQSW